MTYYIEVGIYKNCCISSVGGFQVEASDDKEAEAKAERRAKEMEDELSAKFPEDYWWVNVEEMEA